MHQIGLKIPVTRGRIEVFTEDCFSGRLTSADGHPREIAPFPRVSISLPKALLPGWPAVMDGIHDRLRAPQSEATA
jgi:hypothetical protein